MDKSPDAFRTISEVAELLETPAHVLRFWESRFPQIKPVKRAGGRRYYRPADVDLLTGIRKLLHDDGMTIRGVQKILREQGVRHVSGLNEDESFEDDVSLFAEDEVEEVVPSSEPIQLFPSGKRVAAPEVVKTADLVVDSGGGAVTPAEKGPEDLIEAADETVLDDVPENDGVWSDAAYKVKSGDESDHETVALSEAEAKAEHDALPETDGPESDAIDEAALEAAISGPSDAARRAAQDDAAEPPPAPPSVEKIDAAEPSDAPEVDESVYAMSDTKGGAAEDETVTTGKVDETAVDAVVESQTAAEVTHAEEDAVRDLFAGLDVSQSTEADQPLADAPQEQAAATTPDQALDAPEAAAAPVEETQPEVQAHPEVTQPKEASSEPEKTPLPAQMPADLEIRGHWLPADLRSLRPGAFGQNRAKAEVLIARLEALRNRVGDLGRVPRR